MKRMMSFVVALMPVRRIGTVALIALVALSAQGAGAQSTDTVTADAGDPTITRAYANMLGEWIQFIAVEAPSPEISAERYSIAIATIKDPRFSQPGVTVESLALGDSFGDAAAGWTVGAPMANGSPSSTAVLVVRDGARLYTWGYAGGVDRSAALLALADAYLPTADREVDNMADAFPTTEAINTQFGGLWYPTKPHV